MSVFSFAPCLEQGLASLGLALDTEAIGRLAQYCVELKKWSQKMNLIAKNTGDRDIVEAHFLDSLTMLPFLQGPQVSLLDVGTGAGFPGLVLKAVRQEIDLTLVEPRQKRVAFLNHIARTLGLSGVRTLCGRIEDEHMLATAEHFTHITSRAVIDIAGFVQMVGRFLHPGARLVCMKGPKWQDELAAAQEALTQFQLGIPEIRELKLPFSGAERALLSFEVKSGK